MTNLTYTNIFDAITDNPGEAADLEFRADLLLVMRKIFEHKGWGQADIMDALGISQPRASELTRGKVDKFSSDKLIGFLAKLGFKFKPKFNLELFCEVKVLEVA
ncbi:helix-turn-helix domain-containing protein [Shewanella sp. 5S214]|uniref:helix-turn-helix domain-containing protein n=1 Tax=Shewanella sp. 5S214 TaxID=3229999 RepID=UPI00352E376C